MIPLHIRKVLEACALIAGFVLFGLLIHLDGPLRILAIIDLAVIAFTLVWLSRKENLLISFGITRIGNRRILILILSIGLGLGLGLVTRIAFSMPVIPGHISWVVLLAPLIGITEELVFRGFIQGYVRAAGRYFSMLLASGGHTLYKLSVIASLSEPEQFNILSLVIFTFGAGMLFSLIRDLSGSVLPSGIAHGIFDIVLYGGFSVLPFWVWG